MLRHERRHSVAKHLVQIGPFLVAEVKEVREGLHPGRLSNSEAACQLRVGEPTSAVARVACRDGRGRSIPIHSPVHRRVGVAAWPVFVVLLMTSGSVLRREVVHVILDEVIHTSLVLFFGLGG